MFLITVVLVVIFLVYIIAFYFGFKAGQPVPRFYEPKLVQTGLTENQIWESDEIMALNSDMDLNMEAIVKFVRAIEKIHGIKAPIGDVSTPKTVEDL